MRRRMTPLFSGVLAVFGVLGTFVTFGTFGVATPPLHAETVDEGSASLGWQTQNAPFVVLATADPPSIRRPLP